MLNLIECKMICQEVFFNNLNPFVGYLDPISCAFSLHGHTTYRSQLSMI